MDISALQSFNYSQYLSLLSNPVFLNAVKTAATTSGGDTGKYDALFENLGKLSSLISSSNSASSASQTSPLTSLPAAASSGISESAAGELALQGNMVMNQALGDIVNDIISNADLMQSLLDLEVIPPDEELIELFKRFRDIIKNLDKETRENHKSVKDKEIKTEYKLRPSSDSKSGFQEGLTLLAK